MKESELILNADGSIYHLAIRPDDLAPLVITVGDPERVGEVSKHFDQIRLKRRKREFVVHTGELNHKAITCMSTGMGSDNIDIVINELDALVNIDLNTRLEKERHTSLQIVRIGTSGGISPYTDVDEIIKSEMAIGLEGLMLWYEQLENTVDEEAWYRALENLHLPIRPFVCQAHGAFSEAFKDKFKSGITLTTAGFYAPQSRSLRLKSQFHDFIEQLGKLEVNGQQCTNIEMETAAIYGMAKALGHRAYSINAILANRLTGTFSKNPHKIVEKTILETLEVLCT